MYRITLILALVATPALAASAYLVAEWYDRGDQFCRYDNGTVLNMGGKPCPTSIEVN